MDRRKVFKIINLYYRIYLRRVYRGIELEQSEDMTTANINEETEELNQEYISDCMEGIKNLNY